MQPSKDLPFKDLKDKTEDASAILKAIGNERRLRILCHLARGEHAVGDLEALVGLSQSALSQHLARLREGDLVTTRRSAQTVFYDLKGDTAKTMLAALDSLFAAEQSTSGRSKAMGGRNGLSGEAAS